MNVSEIERVATMADRACADAIEQPTDIGARERLFDMLMTFENPLLIAGEGTRPAYLQGLLRQACVLAENARRLIDESRGLGPRAVTHTASITRATHELRRVLTEIISYVSSIGNV